MKKLVILMSTYNGEEFLKEQLESLLNLDSSNLKIDIRIRDDGSSDNTINILERYSKQNQNIKWYQGKNKGPAFSFLELLSKYKDYDYYAFCDQDDVWDKEKMVKAVELLEKVYDNPALYFSAVNIVDANLKFIMKKEPSITNSFEHSFVANPVIGCTLVFNKELAYIINQSNISNLNIGMHDSWIYRVAQSIDAKIIYDSNSYIMYRQHGNNVVGIKTKGKNKLEYFVKKNKRVIGDVAKGILNNYEEQLSDYKKQFLKNIVNLSEDKKMLLKIKILMNKKLRTESWKENLKFRYDVLFNRI